MKLILIFCALIFAGLVHAEEESSWLDTTDRDPAAVVAPSNVVKRSYPGGADEEDLQVQNHLPEAGLKTDSRSLQREVYKVLYNQELKDERKEDVEE